MKKKKVIITTAAILLVVILVVAAILLLKSDAFGMNSSQRKKPVAVVGGSEKITANELAIDFQNYYGNIDNYNMYALYYGVGTYHDVSTPEGVEELRQEILHELIEQRAYVCLAKEKGITLTAEEKALEAEKMMRDLVGAIGAYLRGNWFEMLVEKSQDDFVAALKHYVQTMNEKMMERR